MGVFSWVYLLKIFNLTIDLLLSKISKCHTLCKENEMTNFCMSTFPNDNCIRINTKSASRYLLIIDGLPFVPCVFDRVFPLSISGSRREQPGPWNKSKFNVSNEKTRLVRYSSYSCCVSRRFQKRFSSWKPIQSQFEFIIWSMALFVVLFKQNFPRASFLVERTDMNHSIFE